MLQLQRTFSGISRVHSQPPPGFNSTSVDISFYRCLYTLSPTSTLHRLNQAPNLFSPATAFSSTMPFNSRCSAFTHHKNVHWITIVISYCQLHIYCTSALFIFFCCMCIIPVLRIVTPHSLYHLTSTSKLLLTPWPSEANNELSSANQKTRYNISYMAFHRSCAKRYWHSVAELRQ